MKNLLNYLWVAVAGFAVWLIYKLFVEQKEKPSPLDLTSNESGLSKSDIEIYNKVYYNLSIGGNPYDYGNLGFLYGGVQNLNLAFELGNLLNSVSNKELFAEVWMQKNNRLLTSSIMDVYGDKTYCLIAQNVPNFSQFIL